jgi:Icc-related predicted phosphoesterase
MRVLILADIDDLRWQHGTGQADLILSLGDIADCLILEAAEAFGAPPIFAVKGNHDTSTPFPEGITDLHLRTVEFGGLVFGGFNGSWKYKPRGHFLYEQDEVTYLLKGFSRVDVFVSHNSPRHIHDKEDETHYGFEALEAYVTEKRPSLFFHGHQHVNKETEVGKTRIVGVYGHRVFEL